MALDRLERASLNRLYKNIAPIDNKIARIKETLQKQIDKANTDIKDLENQKALYQPMIDVLEAKDAEEETTEEQTEAPEEVTSVEEGTTETATTEEEPALDGPGDEVEGIPSFGAEDAGTVPFI